MPTRPSAISILQVLALLSVSAASQRIAAAAVVKAQDGVSGPVQVAVQPDLVAGAIQAFPHLVPGPGVTAAMADRINAALVRADGRVKDAAKDCRASYKQQKGKPSPDAWQRTVATTMRGPRFVSFVAADSYYCGGPYPNDGLEMALVYDLQTGTPVNWLKFLPAGVKAALDTAADGSKVGLVVWPAVLGLARQQADKDCKETFDEYPDMHFSVSLDAVTGALRFTPSDLPHVVAGCANTVKFNVVTLKKLGASKELTDALEAAHKAQP